MATNTYNSALSSTSRPNGTHHNENFEDLGFYGFLTHDDVQVGHLKVAGEVFEEWLDLNVRTIGAWQQGFDGFLGFDAPWQKKRHAPYDPALLPSFINSLLEQDQLESPITSLMLPKHGDEGELLLGQRNQKLHLNDTVKLPLIDATISGLSEGWIVTARNVTFNTPHPLIVNLDDGAAAYITTQPYIILPSDLASNISTIIGIDREGGPFPFCNCQRRSEFPTLTIGLGDGHNFTINGFEYTEEIELPNKEKRCMSVIWPGNDFGIIEGKTIVLGAQFLSGFYSTFDFGTEPAIELSSLAQ